MSWQKPQAVAPLVGAPKSRVTIEAIGNIPLTAENTFEEPDRVAPAAQEVGVDGNALVYDFAPHSLTVLRFQF